MSVSLVVHGTVSLSLSEKRSSLLTRPRHPGAIPVPPSLLNSPFLSPASVFRRKSAASRWPSQEENEWLRDMVPIDRSSASDADAKSEASSGPPSPTSSDGPSGCVLIPPSPMLRPRSAGPDTPTPTKRAPCGPGAGHS